MDKYNFQQLLKDYDYAYYQGGGIHSKCKRIGQYIVGKHRIIRTVVTDNNKLKLLCLLHGVPTESYT